MRLLMTIAVALALVVAVDGDKPGVDSTKADHDMLQGTWAMVEWIGDGVPRSPLVIKVTRATFRGDSLHLWQDSERGRLDGSRGTFIVDPTKIPKLIDFRFTFPMDLEQDMVLGIYDLDRDRLRICTRSKDLGPRPTQFAAPPGSKAIMEVYQRIRSQPEDGDEEP
jgi:uncharacterized protein (TIGR03067 family)